MKVTLADFTSTQVQSHGALAIQFLQIKSFGSEFKAAVFLTFIVCLIKMSLVFSESWVKDHFFLLMLVLEK